MVFTLNPFNLYRWCSISLLTYTDVEQSLSYTLISQGISSKMVSGSDGCLIVQGLLWTLIAQWANPLAGLTISCICYHNALINL